MKTEFKVFSKTKIAFIAKPTCEHYLVVCNCCVSKSLQILYWYRCPLALGVSNVDEVAEVRGSGKPLWRAILMELQYLRVQVDG